MIPAIYAGSFDPVTFGHINIIGRAIKLFDQLIIIVGDNTDKKYMLDQVTRVAILKSLCKKNWKGMNIQIMGWNGLIVDFAKEAQINYCVRGIRSGTDTDYEYNMYCVNSDLSDFYFETVWLPCDPKFTHVSSSVVRHLVKLGEYEMAKKYSPPFIIDEIKEGRL